ncbi:MAG: response regulator, partial [Abditibacteriaceae bacterium]
MEAQRPGDILIIEKDIHFLTETCNILRNARHNVVSCTTAEEGLHHLERIPFDVVLCSNELPDGSGCEICHFIKKTPELQQTSCAVFLDEDVYESYQQQVVDSIYIKGVTPHCEADD